ncbi:unnamed protein product, partial [Polarella glacialis]
EVLRSLGIVLRSLRDRGLTSASAAFRYFEPDQDLYVDRGRMTAMVSRLEVLRPDQARLLVESLERGGTGRVAFSDFRAAVVAFLASSREFHSALSSEELDAIMYRIQARIHAQGHTIQEVFQAWDLDGSGMLDCTGFMAGLRALQVGLSGKEVAQVFNSLSAACSGSEGEPNRPPAVRNGRVVLSAFASLVEQGASANLLKGWASCAFSRLREQLESRSVEAVARRYAQPPLRRYL